MIKRVFLLVAAALLFALPAWGIGPNPDNNPSGNDMVLWHLDDPTGMTWTDSSGNNRPSEYYSGTSVAGLFGTAVSGWSATGGILSPTFNAPIDVTAEAWVYWPAGAPLTGAPGTCQTFFERRTGGSDPFIVFTGNMGTAAAPQGADGQITVNWQSVIYTSAAPSPLFQNEKWYHVAMTAKKGAVANNTTIKVYVTAADQTAGGPVCVLTVTGAKDLLVSSRPFRIGAEIGSGARVFKGYIDEARMSSVALTWFDSFGPAPTTCTLTGDVFGGAGALAGAEVRANGRVTTTDGSGHYELTDVPITSDLENVTVKASGHFAQTQTVPDVQSGGSYYLSWTMAQIPDPCTVSGIVSEAGNPSATLAGVTVRCSDGQITTTDANGAYAFANVPTYNGNVTVTAWSAAYRTGSGTVAGPQASTPYDLPLALTPLTGIVRNPDNNPYDELLMHFDELTGISWADSSGNGRNGHSVANVPGARGLLGGAAGPFSGVYTIDTPVYSTLAGQDMTVEAYCYWPTAADLTGEQIIAARRLGDVWCLTYNKLSTYGVTGEVNFHIAAWSTANTVSTVGANIQPNQWYHIAVTVKHIATNNNDVKIYVTPLPANPADPMPAPVLKGSASGKPDIKAGNVRTYVGGDAVSGARFFKGYIDELRISKIAMTHFDLYGPPAKCTISGVVTEDGDPTAKIEGAVVTNNIGGRTTTDATGAYSFVDAPIYTEPITITVTATGFRATAPATIDSPTAGASYTRDFSLLPGIRKVWTENVYWQLNGNPNGAGNPIGHGQVLIDGNKAIISEGQGGMLLYRDEQIGGTAFVKSTPFFKYYFNPSDPLWPSNSNYSTKNGTLLNGRLYSGDMKCAIHQSTLPTWEGLPTDNDGPWGPGMPTGRTESDCNGLVTDGTYLYGSDNPGAMAVGPSYIYKWSVDPNANGGNGALTEVWKVQIPTATWLQSIGYYNGKLYAAEGFRGRNIYEIDCATGAYTTILSDPNLIPLDCGTDAWYMGQIARCGNRLVTVDWTGHLNQWVLDGGTWVLKTSDDGLVNAGLPAQFYGITLKPGLDGNAKYAWVSGSNVVYFLDLRPTSQKTKLGDPDSWKSGYTVNTDGAVVTAVGSDGFWVENKQRTVGGHVLWTGAMPALGTELAIKGTGSKPASGEKTIAATQITAAGSANIEPLFTTNKNLGPATGSAGLATDGMLVKVSGKVTGYDNYMKTFYIDDGSGVANDTPNADVLAAVKGIKISKNDGSDFFGFWDFFAEVPAQAAVVGIARLDKLADGTIVRRVEARSNADIVITPIN